MVKISLDINFDFISNKLINYIILNMTTML